MSAAAPPPINPFFDDNTGFLAWDMSHLTVWALFVLIGATTIAVGRASSELTKSLICWCWALSMPSTIVMWTVARLLTGRFNTQWDLPFDICNLSGLIFVPLILLRKNQLLFDGVFFTSCTGTIQAFVTPHLYDAFPHITFLKFWIIHGGIILACLVGCCESTTRSLASHA
jgi:hypothetical integral membrane protein (TIGR02206 family)